MYRALTLVALFSMACSTARICGNPPPGAHLEPVSFRLPGEAPDSTGRHFSPFVEESHLGPADPETCGLPGAWLRDDSFGFVAGPGVIYLEGTGDFSNGLTGYNEPVFVGPGNVTDVRSGETTYYEQVAALYRYVQ